MSTSRSSGSNTHTRVNEETARNFYHWRNGWFFRRASDGYVYIEKCVDDNRANRLALARIPPDEWASIVAHVADGGTAESFAAAQKLHNGETR